MSISIRPIVLEDAPGFRRCVGAVAAEGRYLSALEPFPLAEVKAFIRSNLRAKNPAFVVVDGVRIVGWIDIVSHQRSVHAHVGILGMGLLPDYRGQGLGKKLMALALNAAKGKFEQVELLVHGRNKRAQALYTSAGFELCGVKKRNAKLTYGYDDVLVMQKIIGKRKPS